MRKLIITLALLLAAILPAKVSATVASVTDASGVEWTVSEAVNPFGGKKDVHWSNSAGGDGWIGANGPEGDDLYPSIAINPIDGHPFVIWSRQDEGGRLVLAYSSWNSYAWGAAQILHAKDGADILYPHAVADSLGTVHVVWVASTATEQPAYYGRLAPGTSFNEVAIYSNPGDLATYPSVRNFEEVDSQILTYVIINQIGSGNITLGTEVRVRIRDADPY